MPKKYTSEQFWELYKKLPQELKDALFAEETGNNIYTICKRYDIEEGIGVMVDCVGNVLLGLLPPDEFQKTIEEELKMEKETAEKVAREIYRFVFYPVKSSLEKLYKIKIAPSAKPAWEAPTPEEKPEVKTEEKPKEDIYREPIE